MTDIKPLHNYVLVEVQNAREQTLGNTGFVIQSDDQMRGLATGTIVALGPDVREPAFTVGAQVLFPPFGVGETYFPDPAGPRYKFFIDSEILAVVHS